MTQDKPISWMALKDGTPVLSSDGSEVGKITEVVADHSKDIFSGIRFRHGLFGSEHFAPADTIAAITEDDVTLSLSASEAQSLDGS
ncbi:MAG: PRC-barrel domain-containing protein [Actinomycetota bacterium]